MKYIAVFFLLLLSLLNPTANAQCPNYAPVNWFDTTCYQRLPTDIKVGQGHLGLADLWGTTGARSFDFYIPNGREDWAISIVHAWQTQRNILKYSSDVFNWHYYLGTVLKESFGACDPNLNFTGINRCDGTPLVQPFTSLDNYYLNDGAGSLARNDGCFQIDGSTGWPIFPKYYPMRWNNISQHTNYMADIHFATEALAKMYYDLAFIRYMEYVKGYPVQQVLTTTLDNAAGSIWLASAYNRGFFDPSSANVVGIAANRTEAIASSNWLALTLTPTLSYDYTHATSHVLRVLSNNFQGGWTRPWSGTGWTNTSDNQWHCWYDVPISWAIMNTYMNKFFPLYPEANVTTVTAKVKAVFDAINGGGPISFRYQLAPVLDEFILNMPYDDPMQAWLYSTDGNSGCHKGTGCIGPDVKLTANSTTTFCQGLSVDLQTVVGTGYTYQWLKNGTAIPNPGAAPNIYTATSSGTYSVQVTTATGCTIQSDCDITVTVVNCSSCNMSATGSSVNNSCTGVQDGSVSVSITNGAFPVTYSWTGPVSGNTATMNNVPDGVYTVQVVKTSDPTCKAYAKVNLASNVTLYQKIDTTITRVNCSTENLSAQVVSNPPATCNYRLRLSFTGGGCYGFWDNTQLNIIATANGGTLMLPAPRANGGGNCVHLDEILNVPNGASLVIALKLLPTWAITAPNFLLEVLNPSNTVVASYNMNGVSISNPMTNVISLTTNCGVASPNYTMSWTPLTELSVLTNIVNSTTAVANVTTTRTYTVWAQHPTIPACKLSTNITVVNSCPGNLPVEWLYFTATAQEKQVFLNWGATSEVNNRFYEVERSKDGNLFEVLGSVVANGNLNTPSDYRYIDGAPYAGTSYYRIKQIDYDGSSTYSKIRNVNLNQFVGYTLYPNPSASNFNIHSNYSNGEINLTISVTDITGKNALSTNIELSPNTTYSFGDTLPKGIYILHIQDNQDEHTFKLIKD